MPSHSSRPLRVLLLLAFLSCASALQGQALAPAQVNDSLSLDPDVAHVVTGGSWVVAGRNGSYRIVVLTGGVEHVSSALYVQWLTPDAESRQSVVVATRNLTDSLAGIFSLGAPALELRAGQWAVNIEGTHTYELGSMQWTFLLGAPGVVRLVQSRR